MYQSHQNLWWKIWLLGLVVGLRATTPASAANLIWTNTATIGNYTNANNWFSPGIPGANPIDATIFTNDTSYTVNFTANATLATNYFNGHAGTVTLDITGFTWSLTNGASGTSGNGAFSAGQGASTTASVYLAGGTLAATNVNNNANIILGGQGQGTLFVTNGNVIANQTKLGSTATGRGTLVISGTGAIYTNTSTFIVGNTAGSTANSLVVSNSGSLSVNSSLTIGSTGSGGNSMLVDSGGKVFSGNTFTLGSGSSNNTLVVTNNGLLVTPATIIGTGAATGNSATVLSGGTWRASSTWTIGAAASSLNSLTINGGIVTAATINVGSTTTGAGGFNSLTVTNGGSLYTSAACAIGTGTLGGTSNNASVLDGAVWNVANQSLRLGFSSFATGNWIRVDGGVLTNIGQSTGNSLAIGGLVGNNAGTNAAGNYLLIANTGKVFMNGGAPVRIGDQIGATANAIIISNGGQFLGGGNVTIGNTNADSNAYIVGGGSVSSLASNGTITVGNPGAANNTLTVTNATLLSTTAIIGNGSSNNTATILADATWRLSASTLTIGNGAATGNTLRVFGGTVTNISTLTVNVNNTLSLRDAGTVLALTTTVNGVLSGTGKLGGKVTIAAGGTLSPGFSAGTLTFNNDLTLTGTADMELFSGGNLGAADKALVLGTLTGSGLVRVTTNGTFTLASGDKWDLFDWITGTPSFAIDVTAVALPGGLSWDTSQLNIDGTIAIVPEPGALTLAALGLVGLLIVSRRRRHS